MSTQQAAYLVTLSYRQSAANPERITEVHHFNARSVTEAVNKAKREFRNRLELRVESGAVRGRT